LFERNREPLPINPLTHCLVALLSILVACSAAITPTPTTPPVVLRIGFADSVRPLMEAIMPIYGDTAPAVSWETEVGHAATLLDDLQLGRLDAVLTPDEPDGGEEWWTSPVALEGLALIVNPENQVTGLTLPQAQAIFQGQIWSWDAVGGAAAEIVVVTREEGSAAAELFQRMVMEEHRVTLTAVVLPDTAAVLDYVALHPWAIGYVTAAFVAVDGRVKTLAVEGIIPSPETVADQSYPLHFPIYFVARQELVGPLRQFPAWLLSRDGQAVIGRLYGRRQ